MKKIEYRELPAWTPGWWALMIGLLVVMAIGLAGALYMETEGHHVTGMTNQIVWGIPHVFAVFMIVAASGALNVASIGSVFGRDAYKPLGRVSGLLAISLLAGGLCVLVLDLGKPDRLIVAMTHFNITSIFAWNVYLYTGFFVVVGLYLWTMMDWTKKRFYKPAATLAFLWRLILTTGTGSIFGFLVARDAYSSAVMAPLFISMSFVFGLAIFNLILLAVYGGSGRPVSPDVIHRKARLLALFMAADLYFVVVQHITAIYWPSRDPVERFILLDGGIYTWLFWGVQVFLGAVLPMALIYRCKQVGRGLLRLVSSLAVVGGFAQVYVIVIGGQAWPLELFPGQQISSSFADGRIHSYVPSAPEIALGLGGIALVLFLVTLVSTALPFFPQALGNAEAETPAVGEAVGQAAE